MTKITKSKKKKLKKFEEVIDKLVVCNFSKGFLGADPELFLTKRGKVVGSEKVITETDRVVEDGVQVELHPQASYCREILSTNLMMCFGELRRMMRGKGCKVTNKVTVDVSKRHYNSLKDKNKQFGCGRSYNTHFDDFPALSLEPSKYLKRSAGGHIHIGRQSLTVKEVNVINNPKKIIPILDILVGNTAVLLDRDEGNKERRKYYGRAGEYRVPPHGLEYRTLSNFWLISEPIMSLMFGLVRHSIGVGAKGMDKYLLKLVDMNDIIKAINENDYDLAKSNWDKYKHFIIQTAYPTDNKFPLRTADDIAFLETLAEEGLEKHFGNDILKNWLGSDHTKKGGWNAFTRRIRQSRQ